ncbi:MAG: T9SS type A sorting domain-containing protein, partial [Ignavibacteriaceae bacterium]|nr:T9SS type A sorting domain-containing protein [Ignavibacteriaceae bacterium]
PAIPVDAVSNSSRSVIVTFSEKMKNTIDNLQSFYVIGFGYPNSISANNQFSYLLTFNSDFNEGEHKIIVKDIKDYYGSPIQTDTLTFTTTSKPEESSFYVSNFEIINSYKIKLTFNFPVDQNSALNKNNYIFSPDNKVSSVIVDQTDPRIIYLDLTGNKPIGSVGREYVLRIEDLLSDVSTGGVKINSGAGSYLVLSTFAKDLSGVFVYPNPTKENSEKITFANLPQRAKITIWSIDGKMIYELEENDGNGGVDFYLKDFSGNRLSSGVYVYRIVQLDNMRNEGEEKLGKFAIIR